MSAESKKLTTGDKARLIAPVVLYIVLALIAWKLGYFRARNVQAAAASAASSVWISVIFVVVYATIGSLALPVSPLAYGAGAIFGFWRASILIWTASMFGAVAGYYLARGVLAKPARRLLGRYKHKLGDLPTQKVFLTALRMQVMPIVPFGAFTYAAAIAKLDPLPFFTGSAIGIIPGTLLAAFIGDRFAAGVHGESKQPYLLAAAAALLLLAASFAPKVREKLGKGRKRN
ncbi:MAG: TVP38/TMEM64 family protein [Gemmatimonadaceae bacterium]